MPLNSYKSLSRSLSICTCVCACGLLEDYLRVCALVPYGFRSNQLRAQLWRERKAHTSKHLLHVRANYSNEKKRASLATADVRSLARAPSIYVRTRAQTHVNACESIEGAHLLSLLARPQLLQSADSFIRISSLSP